MNKEECIRKATNGWLKSHTIGFMGIHGVGKTSFVKEELRSIIAKRHNLPIERVHVVDRCVSIMDSPDLVGNWKDFGGHTYACPPDWFPTTKEYDDEMERIFTENGEKYNRLTKYDDAYILFLDEYKRGNPNIQNSIMELLLEHTIYGKKLFENTYVVCADNEDLDVYDGTHTDPAQDSRIAKYLYAPSNAEQLEKLTEFAMNGRIHPIVVKFLSQNENMIVPTTEAVREAKIDNRRIPVPRDWTRLGESLQTYKTNGDDITVVSNERQQRYLASEAEGYIGSHAAALFARFCNETIVSLNYAELFGSVKSAEWKRFEDLMKKIEKSDSQSIRTAVVGLSYDAAFGIAQFETLNKENRVAVTKFLDKIIEIANAAEAVSNFWHNWSHSMHKEEAYKWQNSTNKRIGLIMKAVSGDKPYKIWRENMIAQGKDPDSDIE